MLWRLHRGEGEPRIERVDPGSLQHTSDRRSVVLFPGAGLWDGSDPREMAGSIKYVEQTLLSARERSDEPIDIYLYSYELPYEDFHAKADHYAMSRRMSHYGNQAARHVLVPLLLNPEERLSSITPEVLKERLSRLTMVGHSYGSIAMQDVANSLSAQLRLAGWEDATITDTLKELVSVSVAPIARTDFAGPNCTQYFFNSINDMTAVDAIRRQNPDPKDHLPMLHACGYGRIATILERHGGDLPRKELLKELREEILAKRTPNEMPKPLLRPSASGYTISSMLPDDEVRWMEKRPDGSEVCRVLNEANSYLTQTSVVHDYRTYLHGDHKLGDVLINVMNNAVVREPGIGDGHQLMLNRGLTDAQHAQKRINSKNAVSERGLL